MTSEDEVATLRKALTDRRDDLRFCNKTDNCHDGAAWFDLAISDFDAALSDTTETPDLSSAAGRPLNPDQYPDHAGMSCDERDA